MGPVLIITNEFTRDMKMIKILEERPFHLRIENPNHKCAIFRNLILKNIHSTFDIKELFLINECETDIVIMF